MNHSLSPFALAPSWSARHCKTPRRCAIISAPAPFANSLTGLLLALGLGLEFTLLTANAAPGGSVVAWGLGSNGQTTAPIGLTGVMAIAAGESHTVALQNDGSVVAWGLNNQGQRTVPTGLNGVTAIAAGRSHTLALRRDGTVVAWGGNNFGQTAVPAGLNRVTAIAAGESHSVALRDDGTVLAWGGNLYGQTNVPVGLNGITAIAAGGGHTVALKSNGMVVAWGADEFDQTTVPESVNGVIAIAAGYAHTVALKSNGRVVAWGNNLLGQTDIPAGLKGVTAISAGEFHTVALTTEATVVAWGWNDDGQATVPAGLSGVTAIAAGWFHTAALIGPVITTQPVAQSFPLGGGVVLDVSAVGIGLTYQWQFNGKDIPGANGSSLTLTGLTALDVGPYRVVVNSSAGGTATSQDAILLQLFFGDLKFYAGLTLAGTVGQRFRVDYADVLDQGTTNWLVLTTLTLPVSPYLFIDPTSPGLTKRFYRAVPLL